MSAARIGIVGAGFWAAYFSLPFLERHPEARCVGVVRRDREALAGLQRAYDLEVAATEVDELLEAGCDGVIVASPHALHREHAVRALEADAHVLVEKPMTLTLADALDVARTARSAKRTLTLAHGWNQSRLATWAMDVIADGTLGRPRAVTGFMASSLVDLFSGRSGYGTIDVGGVAIEAGAETWAQPDAGGGYLYGQLSHQLGLAFALVDQEPVEVFARIDRLDNGAEIAVDVSVAFADGAIGSFSGHRRLPWGARYPLELRLRGSITDECEVAGEQGFRGRPPDLALELAPGEGVYSCDGAAEFFVDRCLRREAIDRAPGELGVRAVAIMEAAARSARAGTPVAVASLAEEASDAGGGRPSRG